MLVAIYGRDLSREAWAEQFPEPFIVACGRQQGHLTKPSVYDIGLLGAMLKRAHGIPWAVRTGTLLQDIPSQHFREEASEKGIRLTGTPLSEEEQLEIGPSIASVGTFLRNARRDKQLPQAVVIHSYDKYYDKMQVRFGDTRIVNTKAREALMLICESQTTVLTVGERRRWDNGIVMEYEADIPDGIRDLCDLVIETRWIGDAIEAVVRDKRGVDVHIGEELTMKEMKVLLGYPIVAEKLMEEVNA